MKKVVLFAALASNFAFAEPVVTPYVTNGEDATLEDYKDYLVGLTVEGTAMCGGALINGKWILTAKHCTPIWYQNNGNLDATIRVYQGIGAYEYDELVYEAPAVSYREWNIADQHAYREEISQFVIAPMMREVLRVSELTNYTEEFWNYGETELYDDIVLIELAESIPHKDTISLPIPKVLESGYMPETWEELEQSLNPQFEETFTFMGWGLDRENDSEPDVLQKVDLKIKEPELWVNCRFTIIDDDFELTNFDCTHDMDNPDYDGLYKAAYYKITGDAFITTRGVIDYTGTGPGDSGTGLIGEDGKLYGLVSRGDSVPAEGEYRTFFASTLWYADWFKSQIDGLSTPSKFEQIES
ncbi:trypsin-like serine protease, partial [Photobacterium sp. ZSDE20]|nr:trypsin-like serine protease [Photobacterium sp. ZSDE20]